MAPSLSSTLRRKIMIDKTKRILIATIVAVGLASPAFADCLESGAAESCGNASYAQAWPVPQPDYRVVNQRGLQAFARIPADPRAFGTLAPGATGGGSIGYNENMKTDQW
jgi:hypothetical protein